MDESVIFIGDRLNAIGYRNAGIHSYVPASSRLTERVLAERKRCRILAMTEAVFSALPADLARELQEGTQPRLAIVPELKDGADDVNVRETLDASLARFA
jgi:vacuolar-type H+-ATPase subunit F/Vma7